MTHAVFNNIFLSCNLTARSSAVILSILLHALVIAGLVLHFSTNKKISGNNPALQAYVYRGSFLISRTAKLADQSIATNQAKKILSLRGVLNKLQQNRAGATPLSQRSLAGKRDRLVIILHNLIQQRLSSVSSLSLAAGDRVVRVAFDLSPDGRIGNIIVGRTSGVELFDRLAKQAVSGVQPVAAAQILSKTERFTIDVEFA